MFTDIRDRVWLTPEEIDVLFSLLPTPRGKQRVDDNLVLSGIIFVLRTGCRWRDAPDVYGPHKTLYTRWRRWSKKGLFIGVLAHLALLRMSRERNPKRKDAHMDATHCKAHPRACCGVCHTEELGRLIDKTKGGQNTKLHGICDGNGRIFAIHLTEGTASDYKGAKVLLEQLPKWIERLAADMGYDGDWVRDALECMGIEPCIPGRKNRVVDIEYDTEFYKERNKIERAFCRIKDWRRVATRYDRCPEMFESACALAAIVMFWL